MRFVLEPQHSQSGRLININRCFYNCPCLCCRQGCCVIVVGCCCCCVNINNSCNKCSSRTSYCSPPLARKKACGPGGLVVSIVVGTIIALARWTTAIATLISSCVLLELCGSGSCANNKPVPVPVTVPTAASATTSSNTDAKLKSLYGHSSYDITNDQQLKSKNLCKMFCNSRNRKRQRRRRRRRRRRSRHSHNGRRTSSNKQQQQQQHQTQQHEIIFRQRLTHSLSAETCASIDALKAINATVSKSNRLRSTPARNVRVSSLKAIISSWPSANSSTIRHCSKIKRNRANLIWLLIGLVWFEVKLINCNAIGSSSSYVSNFVTHKGCTICHEESKANFYSDKDNPHTDYNSYNKYNNNNYFYKKTNRPHNNIAPSDRVRLESIKRQILTKLGLTHKPNVSHPLPKQFIWETIYRADGGRMVSNDAFDSSSSDFGQRSRLQELSPSEINRFNERDGTVFATSDPDPHQDRYRSPVANNFNISRSPKYEKFMRDRTAIRAIQKNHEDDVKSITFKNWPDIRQFKMNSRSGYMSTHQPKNIHTTTIATKQRRNGHGSDSRNSNGVGDRKGTSNAFSKSTYLIDINRSSDSRANTGMNGGIKPNDHVYFNDYSVQVHDKSQYESLHGSSYRNGQHPINIDFSSGNSEDEKHKRNDDSVMSDQENFDREDFFGNTQEIITFAEEGTQYRQYRILEFSPQKERVPSQKLYIRSAQIHIRIDKPPSYWDAKSEQDLHIEHLANTKRKWQASSHHRIKIWVFQLTAGINITEKGIDQAFLFRASFNVDTKRLGWQKFDLTETIRKWYSQNREENLRLLIDCTGCGRRYSLQLFRISMPSSNSKIDNSAHINPNPNRPFLVLHTESTRNRRVRRRAVDCGGALSGQCCKESFYVSFKALGWDDWIIAPRGYFANYCRGDCTGPFRTPDTFQTFHAHFIEEYRKMGLLNGMRPCCAPVKFSSMSLIYYGDDGIIKRDLPKMVVDECGCP
ncbi:inhibin beta chain [Drosophila subobscura]|uniref:inhibin beta chain n=1 Tax=Drosophila subobscura TaxID=7241 RepID=UPI00155ADF3E|nr:inhibin beta chain [Drosophila subobscura]